MPNTEFLAAQLNEVGESWKPDHEKAMECRTLEELLRKGISFFHLIRAADDAWSRSVQDGKSKFDAKIVREIHRLYQWWLRPVPQIRTAIEKMEQHFEVDGASEFRRCVTLVNNLASTDVDALIRSVGEAAKGNIVGMEAVSA